MYREQQREFAFGNTYLQSISVVLSAHLGLENSSFIGRLMTSLRAGYTTMVNPATGIKNSLGSFVLMIVLNVSNPLFLYCILEPTKS